MNFILRVFLLMVVLHGCSVEDENPCDLSFDDLAKFESVDSLINDSLIFRRDKQSKKFNYDEPSLLKAQNETYRFGMDCTGGGNYSKIVRIEKSIDGSLHTVIKEFDGITGSPDTKGNIHVFELPNEDWESLKNLLETSNFWTSLSTCDKHILHGCSWYIEAYNPIKNKCTQNNFHKIAGCYPVDSSLVSLVDFFDKLNGKEKPNLIN